MATKPKSRAESDPKLSRPKLATIRPYGEEKKSQPQKKPANLSSDLLEDTQPSMTDDGAPPPDLGAEHIAAASWVDPADAFAQDESGQEAQSPEETERDRVRASFISPEAFYTNFKMLFFLGSVAPYKPFPIKALAISPEEEASARAASDVIYEIIAEVTWLHFLLGQETVWAERASILMMFFGAKIMAVRMELAERQEVAKTARETQHDTRGGPREGPGLQHSGVAAEDTQKL